MKQESKQDQLFQLLSSAPKPQLHLHLDGSLSYAFIKKSLESMEKTDDLSYSIFGDTDLPSNEDDLYDLLMEKKAEQISCGSVVAKNSNWKIFDFCNQFLQTSENLSLSTYELVINLNKQYNVNYIEIRFAPVLHIRCGLTKEEAVRAVVSGLEQAFTYLRGRNIAVNGGIILCCLRSFPIEEAFETIDLCKKCNGVIGFDIAGDEGTYPLNLFKDVISSAKREGLNVTVHAGEWNEKEFPTSLQNVILALELNVDRIGHGLALRSADSEVFQHIQEKNTAVEVCLTANCGNENKCKTFAEHPLQLMLKKQVNVSGLNADNLLLSGNVHIGRPNPTKECVHALLDCLVSPFELLRIIENGYNAAFVKDISILKRQSISIWREYYIPKVIDILNS